MKYLIKLNGTHRLCEQTILKVYFIKWKYIQQKYFEFKESRTYKTLKEIKNSTEIF